MAAGFSSVAELSPSGKMLPCVLAQTGKNPVAMVSIFCACVASSSRAVSVCSFVSLLLFCFFLWQYFHIVLLGDKSVSALDGMQAIAHEHGTVASMELHCAAQ